MHPDHPHKLPTGSHIDGQTVYKPGEESADFIIIGSGAAGSTAAQFLTEQGFSVIILEEGPYVPTHKFGVDVYPGMKSLFRDIGSQAAQGKAIFPILQGRCVGGSTTINSAIAWRAPESVYETWQQDFGIDFSHADLEPHFDYLDKALTVKPVEDCTLGQHNNLFGLAANRMGMQSQRTRRYDSGCEASASCLTGCRSGKKMAMNIAFIPQALHKGARLYSNTKALKISKGPKVHTEHTVFYAKRGIILAASAIQTPGILKRSGLRNKALGRYFQIHPASSLVGYFDRDISMQTGATQGYNSIHFLDSHRFKLEVLSLPPELITTRLPLLGPQLSQKMLEYKQLLNWAIILKAGAHGTVKQRFGKDWISYTLTPADMNSLRQAYKTLSEMMFAVGAKEVLPCVYGMPILRSADDLKLWDDASIDPKAYSLVSSHLFGTTRMGPHKKSSVVDLNFQVHGMDKVYVLDSSIFPTNIGVNPQHTIMAVARLGTSRLV